MAERLLPIPEDCVSNPVIGEFLLRTFIYCQTSLKRQKYLTEAENGSFFIKKSFDRLYIVHAIETFVYKSRVFV